MRSITVRPEAEADIRNIAAYTIEQWGIQQARSYVAELRLAIEDLVNSALRHPLHDDIIPSLRKRRSGHHLIFYFVSDEAVDIARVLHERMDVEEQI